MRLRLALIGLLTVCLPLAIPPADASPPKPKTVVITVAGAPGKVTLKVRGPKKYIKSVRTRTGKTLKRLRPGVYRVSARRVDGYRVTVKPAKARVTTKHGARFRVRYESVSTPDEEWQETQLPPQPWSGLPGPAAIALVSSSSSGVPGNGFSDFPTWSPDGTRIAFSSCATNLAATTGTACYVYIKTLADGSILRIPYTNVGSDYAVRSGWGGETRWARVGDRIAFTSLALNADQNKDIFIISPTGSDLAEVTATLSGAEVPRAEWPRWSPTAARLAFRSNATHLAGGTGEVYVTPSLPDRTPLSRLGTLDEVGGLEWAADGASLFFIAGTYDSTLEAYTFDLYRQSLGGTPQRLTNGWQAVSGQLSPSPDGSRVAVTTGVDVAAGDTNESEDVYAASTSGGAPVRLSVAADGTPTPWYVGSPVWSPDGKRIAFVAEAYEFGQVLLIKDLTTGRLVQIMPAQSEEQCPTWGTDEETGAAYCEEPISFTGQIGDVQWSPDGSRIAFSSSHNGLVPGDGRWTQDVFVATP